MVLVWSVCGACGHQAREHRQTGDGTGKCTKRGCKCPGFKPKEV